MVSLDDGLDVGLGPAGAKEGVGTREPGVLDGEMTVGEGTVPIPY